MVAKLITLHKKPADVKSFDEVYFNEHMDVARKIPGLQLIEVSRVVGAPQGEADFYLMTELYFENLESVKAGMASPEGKEAIEHLKSFAGEQVSSMFAEVAEKN